MGQTGPFRKESVAIAGKAAKYPASFRGTHRQSMDDIDTMTALTAALNMALALVLGALIGSERQVRQRMAGLRTNALVALGAAAFVVFS